MISKQSKWLNPSVCVPGRSQSSCFCRDFQRLSFQALLYTLSDQRYIRRYGIRDPTQRYIRAGDETTP